MPDRKLGPLLLHVGGVVRGTSATVVSRVIDGGSTAAFYVIAARSLAVSDFGRLVLVMTVLATVASAARFGLDQALLTVAPSGGVNRFSASVLAGLSAAVAVITVSAWGVAQQTVPAYVLCAAAALPFAAFGQFVIGALRARRNIVGAAVAEGISQPAGALVFGGVAAITAPSVTTFILAFLMSWAVTLVFALGVEWSGPFIGRAEAMRLLATGRSMLGVALSTPISASADVLILGMMASTAEVARYAPAQKLAAMFLLLHAAITASVTPYMRALADRPPLLADYHRVVTRWAITAALPLLVLTAGEPLLCLRLFGKAYATGSSVPLVVLSIAAAVILLSGPAGSVLLCTGHERELFRVTAAGTVVHVACVGLLSPFGAVGVACGVLAGRLIARGMLLGVMRRLVARAPFDVAMLLVIAAAISGVLVARLTTDWFGAIGAAAIGCAVALAGAMAVLVRSGDVALLLQELRSS